MRYLLLFILFYSPIVIAYDTSVSVFAGGAPKSVLDPGFGVELSTALSNKLIVGAGFGFSEPLVTNERAFQPRLSGRILYDYGLENYIYPLAEVNWSSTEKTLQPWVGIGAQHNLISSAGVYAETAWMPNSANFRIRVGARFWLQRINSLDSRVKSANPAGVVYTGGLRSPADRETPSAPVIKPSESVINVEPSESMNESTSENANDSINESTVKKSPQPSQEASALSLPEPSLDQQQVAEVSQLAEQDKWYVHLGMFSKLDSLKKLEFDPRLLEYSKLIRTIFDEQRGNFRLLLGPIKKSDAQKLKQTLLAIGLDNFLYQIP